MPDKQKDTEVFEVVFLNIKGRGTVPRDCGMSGLELLRPLSTKHLGLGLKDPSHAHARVDLPKSVKLEILGTNGEKRFRLIDARNGTEVAEGSLLSREAADWEIFPGHELMICTCEDYPEIELTCRSWGSPTPENAKAESKPVRAAGVILKRGASAPKSHAADRAEKQAQGLVVSSPTPTPEPVPVLPATPGALVQPVLMLEISKLRPLEGQPRIEFFSIKEMADSLRIFGQRQPVTVRVITGDPKHTHELIDGERRLRGAILAGLTHLKAIVEDPDEKDVFFNSFVANWNRDNHSPYETVLAIKRAVAEGRSAKLISEATGKTLSWVYGYISVGKLPHDILSQMAMSVPEKERLRYDVALLISRLPNEAAMREVWEKSRGGKSPGEVRNAAKALIAGQAVPTSNRPQRPFDRARVIGRALLGGLKVKPTFGEIGDNEAMLLLNEKGLDAVTLAEETSLMYLELAEKLKAYKIKVAAAAAARANMK